MKIYNGITDKVNELMGVKLEKFSYIDDEVFKEAMGLRVPGMTIGEVKINTEFEVISIGIYSDVLKYFKDDIKELNEFKGLKIK